MRRVMCRGFLVVSSACFAWAAVLVAVGGFDASILGVRIRSNNPGRVLLIGSSALTAFLLAGGWIRIRLPWRPVVFRIRSAFAALARRPGWIAAGLAAMTMACGLLYSVRTAGGADVYGYMSQADLWLEGRLKVAQPWVADVPWPEKRWSFSPLGYQPAPGADEWAIVPTYSPGLPLLLAAAKTVAGQCGLFAVVPLLGAVATFVTYGLGRRLGSPLAGLIAAWFVATSPAVLGVLMDPLSDVPAMAVWSLAFYCALGRGLRSAAAAGVLASLAILIRPNLVVLAGPIGLWFLLRHDPASPGGWRTRFVHAGAFVLGVLPGVVGIALLNQYLYGSPLLSGYGRLEDLFARRHILPNLGSYVWWYVQSETPIALVGMIALALPSRRLWPGVTDRSVFVVIGFFVIALWAQYAAYLQFDSWGFLRFLLPSWPFLMLGMSSALLAAARLGRRSTTRTGATIVAVVIIALGLWNLAFAKRHGVFDQRQASRHDVVIGPILQAYTEPNSVVITIQRSGSVRYYGGRVTMRYDYLSPDTLDGDVNWLKARGVHVYALMDERERTEFTLRFSGQQTLAAFDRPLLIYEPAGLWLVDLTRPPDPTHTSVVISEAPPDAPDCVAPVPRPQIVLR